MQIYPPIQHPLEVNQRVEVDRPSCACKGAKIEKMDGTIGKVIKNHTGYWYFLSDRGITVKSEWVKAVI